MKKLFSALFLSFAALGATCAFPLSANAESKTLGFAGGFSSYNNGGYGKIYFQCPIVTHVRIAPEMAYVFRNENKSGFEFSVDAQFPFKIARGVDIYPLAGLTINNWTYKHDGHATRAGIDFGAGFDFNLTPTLKLTLQGKYSAMNDTGGAFFDVGIGYNF